MKWNKWMLVLLMCVTALLVSGCGESKIEETADYAYVLNSTGEWVRLVRYTAAATEVVIPDALGGKPVKEIGANTFAFSPDVTSITIPASVTKIEDPSFSSLTKLSSIKVAEGNVGFVAVDNVLFHKKMKTVYCYPQGKTGDTYVLPDTITTIGAKAFYQSRLKEITFPEKVTKVLAGAFQGSKQLTTVHYSEKLSQIYESAFADCVSLKQVVFPESLTSIAAGSFAGCVSLTEIVVPARVSVLDAGAFDGCKALTKADILTSSVQRISSNTFRGCEKLTAVTYAAEILGVGDEAFKGCASLQELRLTDAVATIGRSAFEGCVALKELYIPDGLVEIGAHALDATPYQEALTGDFAVTKSGVLLAARGSSTEITVPSDVKRIAFTRADVTSVIVPEGVLTLSSGAFADCTALKEISLPSSLTAIGQEAFKNCSSLSSFTAPAGLAALGDDCFVGCTAVTDYNVAEGNLIFMADKGVLYDNSRKCLIWYPSASPMTSYTVVYGATNITAHAVQDANNLEIFDVSVAQDIQEIGDYVLSNCKKLKTVKFTENIVKFGAHAMEGDAALTDFSLTPSMTNFGDFAFSGCTGLGDQVLSSSLGKMGENVFKDTVCTFTVHRLTQAEEYVKTWDLKYTLKN